MIVEERVEHLLITLDQSGPLMWTSDTVPWAAFDLALLGLAERGPVDGSVQITPLGRSYVADVIGLSKEA